MKSTANISYRTRRTTAQVTSFNLVLVFLCEKRIDHFHEDVTRLWGRIKARLLMFELESVNKNLCMRFRTFSKGLFFACSFEENKWKRRSSILADEYEEKRVNLVASVTRFVDVSAYAMRRCGLNIFSLSNEEDGDVPFLPLDEEAMNDSHEAIVTLCNLRVINHELFNPLNV